MALRKGFISQVWQVAATYMGTVVGAGFASGQETLKFFAHFGGPGIIGLIVSTLLFCAAGTTVLFLGRRLQAASFREVVMHVCGPRLGPLMDLTLGLFLFCTLSVMLAGAGAVFFQQWGLPYWLGVAVTVVFSVMVVLLGLKGVIGANTIVVPIMVTLCLSATIPSISGHQLAASLRGFMPLDTGAAPCWLLSALLYVAYNITLGISVLAPLGREIKDARALLWGGLAGGLGLGVLAMSIDLAILTHYPGSAQYEIPSLFVAGRLAWTVQLAFSFILWGEIFTTVIGTIYGVTARLVDFTGFSPGLTAAVLMLLAAGLSTIGFSNLVGTVYPLFGYISLIFLGALLLRPLFSRR